MLKPPLVEAVGLTKRYASPGPPAVDHVSLRVERGETLGLVGESGCGKSTLGRCLLRLQTLSEGTIRFDGQDISTASMRALRPLRPRMQMIFQDPYGALNPRRQVGDLIAEPLRVHRTTDGRPRGRAEIGDRVGMLAEMVGLTRSQMTRYPYEFSGGQRQRVGIARALALDPDLIVADEPVSALDVSVQAQIVNLLMDLQDRLHLTTLFIAHDLAVVRQIATRTAVMYGGMIVEIGPTLEMFAAPAHPYTSLLLASIPGRGRDPSHGKRPGREWVETPEHNTIGCTKWGYRTMRVATMRGCRFRSRCCKAQPLCATEAPPLSPLSPNRAAACHFPD